MTEYQKKLTVSGHLARLTESRLGSGSWTLYVDDTPQSCVETGHPDLLRFDYIRRIGYAIDAVRPAGEPITTLHLGGGALTLPRYIHATRPRSRQQVIELEPGLIDLVREHIPLPRGANIRIRYGDAREVLGKLPPGLTGAVDLAIVDIFSGARTPAHVTSTEFYAAVAAKLAMSGILTVNVADGAGLAFARSQVATLGSLFPHVAFACDTALLKARRFGNIVVYASAQDLPFAHLPRLLASGHSPAKLVAGDEARAFAASAPVVTDATAIASPPPARNIFITRPTRPARVTTGDSGRG